MREIDSATSDEDWWTGGKAPILVVQPMQDTIALIENAQLLKKEFGERVTVVEIDQAGHAFLPEQPKAVAKAVIAYIKSH